MQSSLWIHTRYIMKCLKWKKWLLGQRPVLRELSILINILDKDLSVAEKKNLPKQLTLITEKKNS